MKRFKKLASAGVSLVMLSSLVACTFNPADMISNILPGNGNGNGGIANNGNPVDGVKATNKDAVFKEVSRFSTGQDYIDRLIYANGKFYSVCTEYEYPEDYGIMPIAFEEKEETEAVPEGEEPVTEEYYVPESEWEGPKATFIIVSFTGPDDMVTQKIELEESEYVLPYSFAVDNNGDYFLGLENYVYDENTGIENLSFVFKKLDSNLNEITSVKIESKPGEYISAQSLTVDGNGNVYIKYDDSFEIYDNDLKKMTETKIDTNNLWYNDPVVLDDGRLAMTEYKWNEDSSETNICILSSDGKITKDDTLSDLLKSDVIYTGVGYDYYYRNNTSLYGVDAAKKQNVEVVNFFDSDIDPNSFGTAYFSDKDRFITNTWSNSGNEIVVYEKVPADQVVEKQVITLGANYVDYSVTSKIVEFNKNNNEYRIKVVDYSQYATESDYMAGSSKFYTDLISGNACDIIMPEASNVQNLIDKGVFEDLTTLMDNSSTLKKEDFIPNSLEVYSKDGKIYCVFPNFGLDGYMMPSKYYKEGMNLDDVIAWEKKTGSKAFFEETKTGVLNNAISMSMNMFMDPETGKCNFASPMFVSLLEYANTYPKEYNYGDDEMWYQNYQNVFKEDKALMERTWISDLRNLNWNEKTRFNQDVVIVGFPLGEGSDVVVSAMDVIGVSAKSEHKDVAWEFISTLFTDEFYEDNGWSLPTMKKRFDVMLEEATQKAYWINENGEKEYYDDIYYVDNQEIIIDPMSKEKAEYYRSVITSAKNSYAYDEGIMNIIMEEAGAYFDGQKPAKEVADVIQSRVQIYVNEKK